MFDADSIAETGDQRNPDPVSGELARRCRLCGATSPLVVFNQYHVGGRGDVELAECSGRACEEVQP